MSDTAKLRSRLLNLDRLLDDFDSQLDPLLAQSLSESLLPLNTIQQAKLQVTVPYLVYDLIIIYLKTKGIDPKTHPVFAELERVRQYTEKISSAENPATRKTTVDKAAANRFIKHAITQVKQQQQQDQDPSSEPTPVAGPSTAISVPVKLTSKMLARAQYEEELKETPSDGEDDELEVFDETETEKIPEKQGDEDEDVYSVNDEHQAGKKRRRPVTNPFTGDQDTPVAEASKSKRRKSKPDQASTPGDSTLTSEFTKAPKAKSKKSKHKSTT